MPHVGNSPGGDEGVLGPVEGFSVHNGGIRKAVVFLRVSSIRLCHRGNPLRVQAPARPGAMAARSVLRYCSVSSRDTTSAYFAFKSNRLWSWADCERSPTASRTTIGRKPVWHASTAEARTQPLVVHPVMWAIARDRSMAKPREKVDLAV